MLRIPSVYVNTRGSPCAFGPKGAGVQQRLRMGSLIVASIRTGSLALGDVAVQALLGAFAARQGVLSQEALGKISLLFVRVWMP